MNRRNFLGASLALSLTPLVVSADTKPLKFSDDLVFELSKIDIPAIEKDYNIKDIDFVALSKHIHIDWISMTIDISKPMSGHQFYYALREKQLFSSNFRKWKFPVREIYNQCYVWDYRESQFKPTKNLIKNLRATNLEITNKAGGRLNYFSIIGLGTVGRIYLNDKLHIPDSLIRRNSKDEYNIKVEHYEGQTHFANQADIETILGLEKLGNISLHLPLNINPV